MIYSKIMCKIFNECVGGKTVIFALESDPWIAVQCVQRCGVPKACSERNMMEYLSARNHAFDLFRSLIRPFLVIKCSSHIDTAANLTPRTEWTAAESKVDKSISLTRKSRFTSADAVRDAFGVFGAIDVDAGLVHLASVPGEPVGTHAHGVGMGRGEETRAAVLTKSRRIVGFDARTPATATLYWKW